VARVSTRSTLGRVYSLSRPFRLPIPERFRSLKYLLPSILIFVVFGILPVIWVLYQSTFAWSALIAGSRRFVGVENYHNIVHSSRHMLALGRTLVFVAASLAIQIPLGLGIALLLNRAFMGRGIVRALLILPLTIPPISVGSSWLLFARRGTGFVPGLLDTVGIQFAIRQNALHAWASVLLMDAWHWVPLLALIFLAGLTGVPPSLVESARIDGANKLEVFWHVTLPQLKTVGVVALIIRTMDLFRAYDSIWMLTGGGSPGTSTFLLNMDIVRTVLDSANYGLGSALSLFTLYIIVVLSWLIVNTLHQEVLD
jgi:multiple sugar transport system permease protein